MSNPSEFLGECVCIDEPNVPPDLHRPSTSALTERVAELEARVGALEKHGTELESNLVAGGNLVARLQQRVEGLEQDYVSK